MNPLPMLLSLSLMAATIGCATDKPALRTDAPDGFYRWEHHASAGYVVEAVDSGTIVRVSEITTFTPQRYVVAVFHPNTETSGFCVEIYGKMAEEMGGDWHDIVIIRNHKVYFGVAKRTGSSGDVAVTTDTRTQADAIISMLRNRYSLSP